MLGLVERVALLGDAGQLGQQFGRAGEGVVLSLEACVSHLTGRAARRLRLDDRGLIRPGYHADLVLFDPATVRAAATFDDPKRQAEGVPHVFVSGLALALAAGLSVEEIVGTALSSKESVLEKGFGGLLGHIAPIVGLGTILGAVLERSGGADVLTRRLLSVAGERGAPLAMGLAGLIFGNPVVALTIAVLLAVYLLGIRRGVPAAELSDLAARSLRPIGMILLVIGGGAFFGAVVSATGVGKALATTLSDAGLPVIVLAYLIACGLRLAQGSATVAIVTTGGIVAPLVHEHDYSDPHVALIAIAISAGSIIASHVNDGGFWIISRYFNMSVRDTLKTWTVLETILSAVGFGMAALLSSFV